MESFDADYTLSRIAFHGMHPYYGENHLYSASPTLIETVSESYNAPTPGIDNNGVFTMNGQHPQISSYLHSQSEANGFVPNLPNLGANFSPINTHSPMINSQAAAAANNVTAVSMSGYSTGSGSYPYPMPPLSTAPTLLFRSPALFTHTSTSSTAFQFSSPTFSSPPIQMVAPMGAAGQTTSVMSSMWQHTVPSSMPWALPISSAVHTFSATSFIPVPSK